MYKQNHEDQDILIHAKVGTLSKESSVSSTTEKVGVDHEVKVADSFRVSSSALRLLNECLRALNSWLEQENLLGPPSALSPYVVSSHDSSFHIPLHRLLSMVLQRALKECYGDTASSYVVSAGSAEQSFVRHGDFLCQILVGSQPYGFSDSVVEHPLRIRVFLAQVRAKMWIANGDVPKLCSEWYRLVFWYVLLQLVVELIHHFLFVLLICLFFLMQV